MRFAVLLQSNIHFIKTKGRIYSKTGASFPPLVVTRVKKKKKKERNRGLGSFTKEGSNRHRANPDGREQVRKGREGCSDGRWQRRRDLRGNANSEGPVIHRRLYQNLITSEAKAMPKEESRNTLELSHPRKAGNAEGCWRWLYIPLDHPP